MNPKDQNLIEILIGTHNGDQYLEEQIESILSQSFQHFKIIVQDDNSADNTRKILNGYYKKYPEKFKVLCNESPPFGAMANFSALISHSSAEYVMLCDQDDVWLPNKVSKSLEMIQALEKKYGGDTPLLVHTDLEVVDKDLKLIASSFWDYAGLNAHNLSINRLLVQNVVTGCTTLFNRALAEIVTPIPNGVLMHDHWLALVAGSFGKIGVLKEPTVLYRQHGANVLGAKKWEINFVELLKKAIRILGAEGKQTILAYVNQARALEAQLGNKLPASEKKTLDSFIELSNQIWWRRKYSILKNRFLKGRILQNIGFLLRA